MSDDAVRETDDEFWRLSDVPDVALERGLRALLVPVSRIEAHIVAHLAEVEVRRLHLRAGYRSLFEYCLVALGFSEFEAVFRISAARTARNFPVIFGLLERGEIHLSGLHLLRNHLTAENHRQLLQDARHKTKRQIEEQLAQQFPRPDTPAHLRPLPKLAPLAPGRYRLELTIDEAFKQKLEHAAQRLSHANPSHDFVVVLDRALDALVAQLDRGRFGRPTTSRSERAGRRRSQPASPVGVGGSEVAPTSPSVPDPVPADASSTPEPQVHRDHGSPGEAVSSSKAPSPPSSAATPRPHIPTAVSRLVAERDQHRCTYTSPDGRRCSARAFLQLHHDEAWARGGPDTPDNLRLMCAQHNRLLAEHEFGVAKIRQAIERSGEAQAQGRQQEHASQPDPAVDAPSQPDTALPIPDKVA